MNLRYKKHNKSVFNIAYHLIWCTKYRRPVLDQEIQSRLQQLLLKKAKEVEIEVITMEMMLDHVHLFVKTDPTDAPQYIVKALKGYTSRMLREEFPRLRSRIPTLWTRSYYCESIGHISENIVKQYIEDQKKV